MTPFDTTPTGMSVLDRIFDRIRLTFQSLAKAVTNDRLVSVTFAAATTDLAVRHGLGAPPVTWEVVGINAGANVWQSATVNATPRETIIMQASAAPVTVLVRFT